MDKSEDAPMWDQRLLDRLVDGELTDAEERAVLRQLDRTPGGWRHCALAFVESRCWQREAQGLCQQAGNAKPPVARSANRRAGASSAISWRTLLAMAAVLLLAFGIGRYLPRPWRNESPRSGAGPVAGQHGPVQPVASSTAGRSQVRPGEPAPPAGPPVANLTFVDDRGRQVQVPIFDWDERVAEQLLYRSQPLPNNLLQSLKRHEVHRRQRYVPVVLEDGRHVVVPVQELDIVPVSATAY